MRLRKDRQAARNAGNVQLVARFLNENLGAAWLGGRKEGAVGGAGNILFCTEYSNIGFDLVVIGRDVVVTDGPVVAHAITGADLEIGWSHAQGDASPVI